MNNFYLPKNKRNNLYLILFKNINFKFIIINKIYRLKIAFINNWFAHYKYYWYIIKNYLIFIYKKNKYSFTFKINI